MEENQNIEQPQLIEPYNPTDPIVVSDPTLVQYNTVKTFTSDEESTNVDEGAAKHLDIDGVKVPIIMLNNSSINENNILEFKLEIKEFVPKLQLKIYDTDGRIQAMDVPGMENNITVIMIAPAEGANKKISIRFYITECSFNVDGTVDYKAEFKLPNLYSIKNEQIGSGKLSTYEMLEQIAKDNELGFAATEDCEGIEDKRWRQLYRQTTLDYIQEQLKFAGKDKDSIFEAWIDQFGYLVLVNVAWVFSYEVNPLQLTVKTIAGINTGMKLTADVKPTVQDMFRMISNKKYETKAENMYFDKYENKVNNDLKSGTKNTYYYMKALGSENKMDSFDTEIKEFSLDGQAEENEYTFENVEFIGFDMSDDDDNTPIIVQQKNVENFFTNIYSKSVVVSMPKPNYLLQRGMLIYVVNYEYNAAAGKYVAENVENVDVATPEVEPGESGVKHVSDHDGTTEVVTEAFLNKYSGVVNPSQSGLYYIKDITFLYNYGDEEITQQMTLVKRGRRTNLNNKLTNIAIE